MQPLLLPQRNNRGVFFRAFFHAVLLLGLLPLAAQEGVLSVKQFGAKGTGGDDTAAILAAIKAAAADPNHPPLYFPPGTYKVTGSLTFPLGVGVVRGAGHNSTRIVASGTKPFWLFSFEPIASEGVTVEDLYLDCAHVASAGLVVGIGAHSYVAHNIIARCTDAALVLDGAQNSIVMGNDLRESKVAEKIVNGVGNSVFIRNEHELTEDTIQFVGKDKLYPCCKEPPFSGIPTQNVFGPGNIYSDGGPFKYAIHVQEGSANLWFANNITASNELRTLIKLDAETGGNVFSDNKIQMGASNVPVLQNAGYLNEMRGDFVQVRAAPNAPCTTAVVSTSTLVLDRVSSNDNCFFSTISISGAGRTFITPLFGAPVAGVELPKVFDPAGVAINNAHMVRGSITLKGGTAASVNLAAAAAFQSKDSFSCSASAGHSVGVVNASGTEFVLNGIADDVVSYWCLGN